MGLNDAVTLTAAQLAGFSSVHGNGVIKAYQIAA
jgi:hypothetical protein